MRHFRRTFEVPFKYDESPGFECTKRRPDIRFETPTHDVVVEVDENQHRGYEESCECARISEIVGAIGGKSAVFVRYNPDTVRFGGSIYTVTAAERIDLLVATVKHELQRESSSSSGTTLRWRRPNGRWTSRVSWPFDGLGFQNQTERDDHHPFFLDPPGRVPCQHSDFRSIPPKGLGNQARVWLKGPKRGPNRPENGRQRHGMWHLLRIDTTS